MKMKKIFALLLALVMMFAMVAACEVDTGDGSGNASNSGEGGGGGGGGGDDANTDSGEKSERQLLVESYGLEWEGEPEDITFTIFVGSSGKPPAPGNPVVELIYQLTGVRIEYEFEVREAEAKVGTMVASGNYPDFISGSASVVRSMLLEAESFVPLDDLLPNYPRLYAHYEPYFDRIAHSSPDGTMRIMAIWGRNYRLDDGLDSQHASEFNGPAWWIQKDVIAFNDYVVPSTLEEYFDLLERYKEAYPEIDGQPTLAFEVFTKSDSNYVLKNPPMHLVGMRNEGDGVVVSRDPITVEIHDNKWYAEYYYRLLNEMFKKGLINPQSFDRDTDEYQSVIANGRVLGFFEQQWNIGTPEGVLVADGRIERTYVPLGFALPGYESNLYIADAGMTDPNNGIGITQSCKDVERALKFMDQLMQPEVQVLLNWGIEGEHYYVDENGRFRRTEEQKNNWDNQDWRDENAGKRLGDLFPKIQGRYPDGNAWDSGDQPEEKQENMHDYDREFYGHFGFTRRDGFLNYGEHPGYPELWSIRQALKPKDAAFSDAYDKLQEVTERGIIKVVMADDFDTAWAEYMEEFENNVDYRLLEQMLSEAAEEQRYW